MEKELRFSYDYEGDILEIFKGIPDKAISKDIGDDIWLKVDPETEEILGFTILSFTKRFSLTKKRRLLKKVPVMAEFFTH